MSRLIDADELMEHVGRDRLDSRELIMKMIEDAPTVEDIKSLKMQISELRCENEYLNNQVAHLRGQIKALVFAVRCGGISGNEVQYETD